jgi:hypothetical protein
VGYSIFTKVLLQVATKEVPRCVDVANLIIFLSKNGEKKLKFSCFSFSFSRKKKFHQVCEISLPKKRKKEKEKENCRKF